MTNIDKQEGQETPQTDTQIIKVAVQSFDLGNISEVKTLETKGNRRAFKVTTDRSIVVIKSASPESSQEKVDKDIYILKYLEQFHFPAPRLIQTHSGDDLAFIEGRATYGYQFIEGERPKPNVEYFQALGSLLAQLHTIPTENYPFHSTFIPKEELPKLKDNLSMITRADEQTDVAKLIQDVDMFPSFEHLPKAVIHTDPYFSNIIQRNDQLYCIDLDDAGIAPAIIDLGYVLAHCCTTEPSDREELGVDGQGIMWHQDWAESFLKGYQEVRPLSDEEKRHLSDAARFAMLVYITDWEEENKLSETRLERYKLLSKQVPLLSL